MSPPRKSLPGIAGVGFAVPEFVLTNSDLEQMVETSDEWITTRTGIKERRILPKEEDPVQLGVVASLRALASAGRAPQDLDFVITATNLPQMPIPGTSPFICEGLGIGKDIPFFDMIAGCTGFVYALKVAADLVNSGGYENVLVVGHEALSRFTDWEDRSTCVLFGDGGGAAVVSPMPENRGILGACLSADSSKWNLLHMPGGGLQHPASPATLSGRMHYLKMEGGGVFKSAVTMMERTTQVAMEQAGLTRDDINWVAPHQANHRILKAFAERYGLPMEKMLINIDRYGNTSTASIPIALGEAVEDGRIRPGQVVVLNAFGAGVTYGALVLRW